MPKILKNTTLSDIELKRIGVTIPSSGQETIKVEEYGDLASVESIAEITPLINSGDIVVNDGTTDLDAETGIRFIEYADKVTIQKDDVDIEKYLKKINFEGDAIVTDNGDGKATVSIGETGQFTGKIIDFGFFSSGNTSNKWLAFTNGSTSTDTLPFIMPQDACLTGLTFSNQDDNVDIDIEIYKNGITDVDKVFTWEIRNKRTAWKTINPGGTCFLQGDRVHVYARKFDGGTGDQTAQDPVLEIFFLLTSNVISEGGTVNGV